jgi:hypothetical protein
MADKAKILEAIKLLDHTNDEQWTDDGLPRTDVIRTLADDASIKRIDINEASPGFARIKEAVKGAPPVVAAALTPAADIDLDSIHEEFSDDRKRAILNRRIAEAEANLEAARVALTEARAEEIACVKRVDRAKLDSARVFPPLTAAANIKQHLAAQQQRLIDAASGNDAGRNQLDQAMAVRNRAGWGRPSRPVQNANIAR